MTKLAHLTLHTNIVENSDHDEIYYMSTIETAVIENSDNDELNLFTTVETRELETIPTPYILFLIRYNNHYQSA
ncbi:hypothetical protein [Providencia huaxiensis]|uniref:hypothetical protein n=1 Tax=Providencia huaxiensis TaxID=2027290 RepID=UPI0034DD788D